MICNALTVTKVKVENEIEGRKRSRKGKRGRIHYPRTSKNGEKMALEFLICSSQFPCLYRSIAISWT